MLEVGSEQYVALRNALVAIQDDASAVVSVLCSQSDNGARFVESAYAELRRALVQGNLADAEVVGNLIAVVLQVQESGADDELAENRIHRESMRWLVDGIGAILAQDNLTGITHLENLTHAVYCNDSLRWVAWLWVARAATEAGDLALAQDSSRKALELTKSLDGQAASTALCTMGEIELALAQFEQALEHLTAATESFESIGDRRGLASAWLGRARAQLAAGRQDAALAAASRAAEADTDWAQPVIFIARQAIISGDFEQAARTLRPLAQGETRHVEIERELRLLELIQDGRVTPDVVARYLALSERIPSNEMVEQVRKLVAAQPQFLQARELLAWSLVKLGRNEEAAKEFDELTAYNLDSALQSSVLLGLGCLANRRNVHRQPGARVRAAVSAKTIHVEADEPRPTPIVIEPMRAWKGDASTALKGGRTRSETRDQTMPLPPRPVFTGDLQLFAVPDLLDFLKSSRRTGTLVVTSEHGIGAVHLRQGRLTGAASPACSNVGKLLLEEGALNEEQLKMAAALQREHAPDRLFGALLVERFSVDAEKVKAALTKQVYTAVQEMVGWTTGRFAFEPDKRRDHDRTAEIDIELDTQGVLLDVLRQLDEQNRA